MGFGGVGGDNAGMMMMLSGEMTLTVVWGLRSLAGLGFLFDCSGFFEQLG